ncbi:hypothetical protein K502DRAFT_305610 [Neoconidiobolus thromboides FSU 785]|nr:hypothetical protein K502DRAFT_305610 [Neoconidiobolus thromboides FSU 785]
MKLSPLFSPRYQQIRQISLQCGVVISRIPQITRPLNSLESAYWNYFEHQVESNSTPFPVELYFKKGSLNERLWNERQVEGYQPEEGKDIFESEYKGNERISEADKKNDIQSLERKLSDKLYLVIKNKQENQWVLPVKQVDDNQIDSLQGFAKELMKAQFGDNLDLFWVGKAPIGVINQTTFFMKAHILAGKIEEKEKDIEYAWLSKQEIEVKMDKEYFNKIKDLL